MWRIDDKGCREYPNGKEDWAGAARQAAICMEFRQDVDEETVADEERSCYNCRYRRWTVASFTCHAPSSRFPATACQ